MPGKKTTRRKPSGIARVRWTLQKIIESPTLTEAVAIATSCLALLDGTTPEKRKPKPAPEPTPRCECGCGRLVQRGKDGRFFSPECRQLRLK